MGADGRTRGGFKVARGLTIGFALAIAYLLFWPVPIAPESWTPPGPKPEVADAALANVGLLGRSLPSPEAITFDDQGRIVTGLLDNITWSPARRAVWIALARPREPARDALGPW